MWSGPSGPWNQWPIHASMYQNVPHEQVDWAQLAKQWIQMQQTHPGVELPPQAQHLMASMPPRMSVPPPVQPQQVSVVPALPPHKPPPPPPPPAPIGGVASGGGAAPAGYWGNSSASTWVVGDGKPWATAGSVVPAVAPVAHPPPPPPPPAVVVPQPPLLGVSEKETFDYGHVSSSQPLASQSYDYNHGGGAADQYGPYGHLDLPPPSYGGPGQGSYGQYWGMGSNPCPPPFLRKDRRELREDVQLPFLEEETPQLDAAKRKSLPAWIREGLEKMEREKLRRLERERAEAEHRERLNKKAQQDSDPLKSKFDSDSEDEKGEGVDMFSDGQRGRRPSPKRNGLQTARDASPDEEPLEPRTEEFRFRTAEERQQELMLKVRRMLTELLLEVTNEEVLSLAKEVLQKAIQKAPARQLRSSSALANIATGLGGLRGYGSDSESSSEEGSGEEDSDEELERAIQEKREAFFEWERRMTAELDEADRLEREKQRQQEQRQHEQRLGGADQVTEDGGARSTGQADKSSTGDLEHDSSPGASSPEESDRKAEENAEVAAAERLEEASSSTPEDRESEGKERTSRRDKEAAKQESKSSGRKGSKSSSKQDETRKSGSSRSSSRRSPKRKSRSRSRSRDKKAKKRERHSSSSRSRSRSESRKRGKHRSRSRDRKEKSRKHRRRSASSSESSDSGSRKRRRSRSRSRKRSSRRKSRSRSRSHRRRRHSSESQGSGKRSSRKNRDR
ncbi:arginine/serine-rich protein PNISR isoform X1 [Ixodes scapularis]|uniref:arginine/serine-rich protein PNISR isoform X1 n=1 Tax=Ixodes scapularis TaxID=6945 RepID=UPI001A9E609F|nr:arginine/serine-rich protein PNISR isoform X1 [Ixodes scapularis]XP_040075028.1 arginine/serine-rich protein PNISR isoform X1 [Ixodes scapularis]